MASKKTPSARAQAIAVLGDVLSNRRTLDEAWALNPFIGSEADSRFARLLTLTCLRHLGQLDAIIANYLEKPLPAKRQSVTNALRIGLAQLLLLDTPAHAAVNETVQAVKQGRDSGLSGLVNAILQKAAREKPTLPDPISNLPTWLRTRWEKHYGAQPTAAIAAIAAQRPPLDLHMPVIPVSKAAPGSLAADPAVAHANRDDNPWAGHRLDPSILRLPPTHAAVETLPGYHEGAFFVQDIAASYPARLLGEVRGKRILDLCAAPGGKAAQLARAGAHVTALDRSATRMETLHQNMLRLNLSVETITADVLAWQPPHHYDAILLDAPCSATGTWRRHPEVLHTTTAEEITELAALQRQMLARAWHWLKPGGTLVYCVCSLEQEEGEGHIDWFLQTHADAKHQPADALATHIPAECITDGLVRTLPCHLQSHGGMDGFFAAAFSKRLAAK